MMKKIIALHGDSGCGKDYLAELLNCHRITFATPLRLFVYSEYGLDTEYLGQKEYEAEHNVTHLLLETSREFHAAYPGLGLLLPLWSAMSSPYSLIVFTDLRLPQEMLLVQSLRGHCVHVEREAVRQLRSMDRLLPRDFMLKVASAEELNAKLPELCEADFGHISQESLEAQIDLTMHVDCYFTKKVCDYYDL